MTRKGRTLMVAHPPLYAISPRPDRQAIYRRALAAKREAAKRHAELTALAQHVCFASQFNPFDDTWAAIKVYRDGNPIILDDGFATEEEADDCAELARAEEIQANSQFGVGA